MCVFVFVCMCREKFIESMSKQVDSGLEARHYDWLIQAVDQLKVARRVLAPSYVFAYFTFGQELYKVRENAFACVCVCECFKDASVS